MLGMVDGWEHEEETTSGWWKGKGLSVFPCKWVCTLI
jgi:hypothetical protein